MKIKHILYGILAVLLLLVLIVLVPIDDKLDAEAAAWTEQANDITEVEGNAYYFLMGIMAAASEDPETVGKAIIDDYRRAEQEFLNGNTTEFTQTEYPAEKKLPYPGGELYCRIPEFECFTRLAANTAALREELKTHAVLLDRYQRYLKFDTLKFVVEPMFHERLPSYLHLVRGHKLNQFRIVIESVSGSREQAVTMLHEDMDQLRRDLAGAPNLVSKMALLGMLADDLDLLFNIAQPAGAVRPVAALSPEERSLHSAMVREFGYIPNFHRQLKQNPRSIDDGGFDGYEWLMRVTMKSNMTINDMFPLYRDIAELSTVDAAEFNRRIAGREPEVEMGFNLRNIGGSILNSIAMPSMLVYAASLHDVDCKIALLNPALALNESEWKDIVGGSARLAIVSPYNSEERSYIDADMQALCVNGPFADTQKRRCIRKDIAL